jgi:VIT1/CCC1 family predicted Fe2+/Mn2+ transporter
MRVSLLPKLHIEPHFSGSETVREVVIGMADGLTVPFVLASGVSGAIASTHIVVTAGLAEIVAGAIAMGFSGYIAAKDGAEHYQRELQREEKNVIPGPGHEAQEVGDLFKEYGVTESEAAPVATALHRTPKAWRKFMMRFGLGLEAPDPNRAIRSAFTIAGSYIFCGMIPLLPYMFFEDVHLALVASILVTLVALAAFGFMKGHFTGVSKVRCAWQTALVGSLAAGVAFGLAKVIS